jgi:hypothetical protein
LKGDWTISRGKYSGIPEKRSLFQTNSGVRLLYSSGDSAGTYTDAASSSSTSCCSARVKAAIYRQLKVHHIIVFIAVFYIFTGFLMHNLYRMAKASGVLYTTVTGRSIKYYSR